MFSDLEQWLAEITGFAGVSLQPNAGSQGEYAGLLVIRAYHEHRGQAHRDVCLIPESAHGTNPASAVIAGFKVVSVKNTPSGDVDLTDLKAKIAEHRERLGALMVTYPSTYGVFEEHIREICDLIHEAGGQVYMDGANMNAQVGLCRPGDIGATSATSTSTRPSASRTAAADRAWGPSASPPQLVPSSRAIPSPKPVSSGVHATGASPPRPTGSPSILAISWVYIALMGAEGLRKATQIAILNANYMAKRLSAHFPVLFKGSSGFVAHEFILDVRPVQPTAGITVDDTRQASHGLRLPRPHDVLARPRHAHVRAHRERAQGRARPPLRRDDLHPRRDR